MLIDTSKMFMYFLSRSKNIPLQSMSTNTLLTHSHTHSLTPTHSLTTHSSTHTPTHPLTHPLTHSFSTELILTLCSAVEFSQGEYIGVKSRPGDQDLSSLVKELPQVDIKNRQPPFCAPYAVKARLLLFASMKHIDLPNSDLVHGKKLLFTSLPLLSLRSRHHYQVHSSTDHRDAQDSYRAVELC